MDGEGLGVGEGLEGDVELGVGAEVAASVSEVGTFEEGGVWERLLVALKAGASMVRSVHGLLYEAGKVDAHLHGDGQLQVGRVGEGVGEGIHHARHHLSQHPSPSPRHSPSAMYECTRLALLAFSCCPGAFPIRLSAQTRDVGCGVEDDVSACQVFQM